MTGLDFLKAAYEEGLRMDYPKFYKMDVLGKMGIVGADVLLNGSGVLEAYQPQEVGIVLSNRNASIEADMKYFETAKTFPSPALFVYTLPNIVIGEISIRYKFKGENAFFISEHFNPEWLYFYVNDLFEHQHIKACICGWLEATNGDLDACLILVEKNKPEKAVNFTAGNLREIYERRRSKAEAP